MVYIIYYWNDMWGFHRSVDVDGGWMVYWYSILGMGLFV